MACTGIMVFGDHLRVCGADPMGAVNAVGGAGSSPRVRSGLFGDASRISGAGIISACAERTSCCRCPSARRPDHLRVCGADAMGVSYLAW